MSLSAHAYPVACGRGMVNRDAAQRAAQGWTTIDPRLKLIDDGQRLRATSSIRPREPDGGYPSAKTLAGAIAEELGALLALRPPTHFVKYAKVDCDSLRDGAPKGGRYHLTVIFLPFPSPRGALPHGEQP